MTIGIYALVFRDTDMVYIGQSSRIEERFKQHKYSMLNNTCTYKLLDAYKKYGIPSLCILKETNIDSLDKEEVTYIREFDSVDNGFNILSTPYPYFRGTEHHNSLYTEEEVYKTLLKLIEIPFIPYKVIAEDLNVSIAFIENIARLKSHTWLKDKYPEEYKTLESFKGIRPHKTGRDNYPIILDPLGQEHTVVNAKQFSEKFQLNRSHLVGVLNGKRASHLGWKLKEVYH